MSYVYVYQPRHTTEEYQRYTPKEYRRAKTVLKIALLFLLIFAGGFGYLIYAGTDDAPSWLAWGLAASFVIWFIGFGAYQAMSANLDGLVDNALLKERDALHT